MLTKKGFTLAEILLAVAIIGVLSMLLLPTVQHLMPSTNKAMFRKAHVSIEKAVNSMINDEDNYPSDVVDTTTGLQRVFNFTDKTGNSATDKFCYYFANQLSLIVDNTCPSESTSGVTQFAMTLDGIYWYISLPTGCGDKNVQFPMTVTTSSYPTKIVFDVNGPNAPNCSSDTGFSTYKPSASYTTCAKNPDTFIIGVRYDGKLQIGSGVDASGNSNDPVAEQMLSDPKNTSKD